MLKHRFAEVIKKWTVLGRNEPPKKLFHQVASLHAQKRSSHQVDLLDSPAWCASALHFASPSQSGVLQLVNQSHCVSAFRCLGTDRTVLAVIQTFFRMVM
jgi:hypothetical protein